MLLPFILFYSLIISYFCSVVIYRLCITRKYYNFFFAVLLYVASGISSLWFGFLFCPLFVWYFWRNKIIFLKITLIASISIMCLGFWQAELPQKAIINMFDNKIEIFDNNYTVLENNNKSEVVYKGDFTNTILTDFYGYDEYGLIDFAKKDYSVILKIFFEDNEESMKLNFLKDYINNYFIIL